MFYLLVRSLDGRPGFIRRSFSRVGMTISMDLDGFNVATSRTYQEVCLMIEDIIMIRDT